MTAFSADDPVWTLVKRRVHRGLEHDQCMVTPGEVVSASCFVCRRTYRATGRYQAALPSCSVCGNDKLLFECSGYAAAS